VDTRPLATRIRKIESLADVQEIVRDYEWFHTMVGIVGNISFFAGSILFLFEATKRAGLWLFVVGSFGMLLGSVGAALVRRVRRRHPWARPGSWDDVARRSGESAPPG
jgi:hypothetical protein